METKVTYKPTKEDFSRIKLKRDMFKVSGDGVFATLQGEGVTSGLPSIFLRLHFCNLACGAKGGWKCDTGYTWDRTQPEFWKEAEDWGYDETVDKIESAWTSKFPEERDRRLVITGGEPLIQQASIVELIKRLPNWSIEIETNGTIKPLVSLFRHQFNCSPKLSNSGNLAVKRYKPEVLKLINSLPKSQFKFVVVKESDLDEVSQIVKDCLLESSKILIMPEGITKEDVGERAVRIISSVHSRGWNLTLRNQLIWFGSKRRT